MPHFQKHSFYPRLLVDIGMQVSEPHDFKGCWQSIRELQHFTKKSTHWPTTAGCYGQAWTLPYYSPFTKRILTSNAWFRKPGSLFSPQPSDHLGDHLWINHSFCFLGAPRKHVATLGWPVEPASAAISLRKIAGKRLPLPRTLKLSKSSWAEMMRCTLVNICLSVYHYPEGETQATHQATSKQPRIILDYETHWWGNGTLCLLYAEIGCRCGAVRKWRYSSSSSRTMIGQFQTIDTQWTTYHWHTLFTSTNHHLLPHATTTTCLDLGSCWTQRVFSTWLWTVPEAPRLGIQQFSPQLIPCPRDASTQTDQIGYFKLQTTSIYFKLLQSTSTLPSATSIYLMYFYDPLRPLCTNQLLVHC